MLYKFKAVSMRFKILLSCLGCMILALVFQTILFQRSSSEIIYAQAHEISASTMSNLQDELYTFNKSIENSLIKIYNQKEFIRDLSYGLINENPGYSQIAYDLAHNAFSPAQNLTALYVYTPGHSLISSYRHAQTPKYNYPGDIFDGSMKSNTDKIIEYSLSDNRVMMITSYYNTSRQTGLIRYVLKIYRNTSDFIGYIVCDIDPKPLLRIIETYRYSSEQIIWLQPDNDKVAISYGQQGYGRNPVYLSIAGTIERDGRVSGIKELDSGYELFMVNDYKYNFTAYSLMPQTVLKLNQTVLFNDMIFVLTLILVLFSLVFILISNSITKPLTYVVNTMNRIKNGETGLRLKKMRMDEIGVLGQEFNDMLDETERLIKVQYEAQMLVDNAKYKALQAQVNPHFLYNTLDTMSSIAMSQDCLTVSTLCKALSNIFRYSLDMGEPYATLENEILHIKNYMYVMNVRMNNSIRLQFDIDSPLLQASVPRLSIQPLVENAINHGLKNKRGSKEITVGAKLEDGILAVSVVDNGVGMKADEINERMKHSVTDALSKSSSVGLDNINARLKLLYGSEYGVSVESSASIGSRVSIRMPSVPAKEGQDDE